ncbi:MAG: thrombospondin type 3 repeat-containing protein [Sandaracinaceae bacterium]
MPRWSVPGGALLVLALFLALPGTGSAQDLRTADFSAHRFYLAPGANNFFLVDNAEVSPNLTPHLGALLGYANQPFVADDLDCFIASQQSPPPPGAVEMCNDEQRAIPEEPFVEHLLTLQLTGAITVLERLQIGLNVPVFLYYSGQPYRNAEVTPPVEFPGGSGAAIGDPRVHLKLRILDPSPTGVAFTLGTAAYINIPVGHFIAEGSFLGDELPELGGHLIGSVQAGGFRVSANAGAAYRNPAQYLRSAVGAEFRWGVGAAYRLNTLIEAMAEVTGAVSFQNLFDSEAPTEVRAGLLLHVGDLTFQVGGGIGVVYGVGVPVARGFAGASWSPQASADADRDGINDSEDGCPTETEDLDGFNDEDGCPDLDNDEDGIPDASDACPNDAEDEQGEGADGCPDDDDDDDGIRDGYDACPNEPEDMDGDRDNDGCPDDDMDQDGIEDATDACPQEPEDFDGLDDTDGCPEEDADGDGVPDVEDVCPESPEDLDGFQDGDGCAEEGGRGRRRRRRGR